MSLRQTRPAQRVILAALLLLPVLRATAQTVVYDLASDWSDTANPNGVWRLYRAPGLLFTTTQTDYWSDASGQAAWAEQPFQLTAHVPFWLKVEAGDTHLTGFATPGTIVMHTAETERTGTEFSSVTWTSPGAGTVAISGGVWMSKAFDRPQHWVLRRNAADLTQGDLTLTDTFTQATPYDFANGSGGTGALSFGVQPNDVIELLIYRQVTSPFGTTVGVNFSVTFTPVPEPSVLLLTGAGLGLLGLAGRRRR